MSNKSKPEKWTARRIRALKGKERVVCLTAYDSGSAQLVDEAGIQLILVGDSLGLTMLGYDSTLPVTMEEMLHHTAAVARGASHALVVADMPFLSYQVGTESAMANAGRFIKEARADAVKIEGGALRVDTVARLVANGIPVMGHIGLTPQSLKELGGYKVQGKNAAAAARLMEDAAALAQAGVFALVLECMPTALAREITEAVSVPTIGIGAGPDCDGQILVMHDMLGMFSAFTPRFVKRYAELGPAMRSAFEQYAQEVRDGEFPDEAHSYG